MVRLMQNEMSARSGAPSTPASEGPLPVSMKERLHLDPYDRIDPFFKMLLGLRHGGPIPSGLPKNFMKPAGAWNVPEDVDVENRNVRGRDGSIPVRIYRLAPFDGDERNDAGCLVWMHGGGFTAGDLDLPEAHAVCAEITERTGLTCISVAYRLVNDAVHYPAPLNDVYDIWSWMMSHRNNAKPLFVGGASAGANLAAALCLQLRDSGMSLPDGFIGAYGVYHGPQLPHIPGWEAAPAILPQALRFDDDTYEEINRAYAPNPIDPQTYAFPANMPLHGFPTSLLIHCEFDDLAQSSINFAAQLEASGVEARQTMALGMLHGFLNWCPVPQIPESMRVLRTMVGFIQEQSDRGKERR